MDNRLTVHAERGTRLDNAERFFREPERYLKRNFRIPLRVQIVRELVGEMRDARILDLGCGDGSISAQFLRSNNHLTLVDSSIGMLERARRHIVSGDGSRTEYVHADLFGFEPAAPYDLVLCIGVLSHVDAVDRALAKVAECVKPNGLAIVQLSDHDTALLRISGWLQTARNVVSRSSLRPKPMGLAEAVAVVRENQLDVIDQRRHLLLLFPGMARLLGKWLVPYDTFTRKHPMLARHGSNVILLCRKTAASEATRSPLPRTHATTRPPRLLLAVTDPMSCALLRGQLASAREHGFDAALLCTPGGAATAMVQRERPAFLPVRMHRKDASYRDLIALMRICAGLRRFRPDIVNAGTPKAGFLVLLAAWICRVPCRIYTLRGLYLETSSGLRRAILWMAERLTCALAHRVVCVSPSLRARALELGIVADDRAVVLGGGSSNGVDLGRFAATAEVRALGRQVRKNAGIADDAIVIGFVGRLARDKGSRELAASWFDLRRAFADAHLLIVGWIEDEGLSPAVRATLRADPRVHVVGAVEEPAAHYAAMDIVVLPTYREGLPNVVLEAGAMELPVVATRVTGCVDAVLHGVTGTLVPARDEAALTEAIFTYIRDRDLRLRHGRAARARVEQDFARERVWSALHAEYSRLLCAAGLLAPSHGPMNADGVSQRMCESGVARGASAQ